ncbi:MAG: hypothetical protein HUU02_07855, partial [Bacteroidetes bacterium]|nr:hypothetical protein [Bacteroidota bacterium]
EPVSSFKYILTLRLKDSGDRSTSVTASVTKVTISNGTPMQSAAVSSSVLTDGFFRLLTDELMFAP